MKLMKLPDLFNESPHQPVLYQEVLTALRPHPGGSYIDATVGAGGHSWGILTASGPNSKLLGLDLDPQALAIASQRLACFEGQVTLVQASYTSLREQVEKLGWEQVDGILLDLGVSSMQIDTPQRGFSFREDGPLDMRFSPEQATTAADLVNHLSESELADLIWRYGEERQSRRIAAAICQARPLATTRELADVIRKTLKGPRDRIDPATLTFQALRIAVNQELQAIETVLPQAVEVLSPAGDWLSSPSIHWKTGSSSSISAAKAKTASARPNNRSAPVGIRQSCGKSTGGRSRRWMKKPAAIRGRAALG